MRWLAALLAGLAAIATTQSIKEEEIDNEQSRKVLGSSVVTSVSVIMDHGNGTKTYIGESNDGVVGSPGDLLSPDRYEFYTFDESGDLVKRLMTLDQIQGLIAGGDADSMEGDASAPTYYHEVLPEVEPSDLQGVHKVVATVQNVLKSELEATKNKLPMTKPLSVLSVPDAASSWSILLPGVLGGPLEDNKAPDSELIERQPTSTAIPTTTMDDTSQKETSWSIILPSLFAGDKSPETVNTESQPLAGTTTTMATTTLEEITQRETTENPTIIHYLPIKNIPPPPKKNSTMHSSMSTTTSSTTLASELSTIPQVNDLKTIAAETMVDSIATDSTQTVPDYPTTATSPETVLEEMAASLSSVISQVANNRNISSTLESNFIPVGLSSQNFGTPGAESRPHTTKIQFSSTTPLTFTTHSQPLHVENKISTEKTTVVTDNTKEKLQVKNTTENKQSVKVTSPTISSTTENIVHLSSLEYNNGAVSDYQMISEALAAQGISDSSWMETTSANQSTTIKESNKHSTDSTSNLPSLSQTTKVSPSIGTATTKPISSTKSKPSTSQPELTSDTKKSTVKSNSTKNSSKPISTISQTKQNTTAKIPTTTKQQPLQSTSTTYTSLPTATQVETSTQVDKKTTEKLNATTSLSKTKPVTKKPNSKPTRTPSTTVPTKNKNQNESLIVTKENEKVTKVPNDSNSTLSQTTIATSNKIKDENLKLSLTKAPLAENIIQSTTNSVSSTVEKIQSSTLNYVSKLNKTSDSSPNFIASSSNRENVFTNTTTENTVESTTNIDLENEGEILQEGISAVTSILLQENNLPPVPANKFHGLNSRPVIGELKHASQISSDDMELTTETKDIYTTTYDSTTDIISTLPGGMINDSTSTEKDVKTKSDANLTVEDSPSTFQYTTEAGTTINDEESSKIINESRTTPFNVSAVEFTTSVYEGTTNIQDENLILAEKKTADYELENGGQSTQLKESKLSPDLNTKGVGIGSNFIDTRVKSDQSINKTVLSSNTQETHKVQSLNFVGNSTKSQIKNNSTSDIQNEINSFFKNNSSYPNSTTIARPVIKRPGDQTFSPVELHPAPHESLGLEASTSLLGDDVRRFADLCNELAFRMWTSITGKGSVSARSLVVSPFAVTSLLAMVFLGARGPTSGQMNDVLRLDDMVTFNPHQVLQNITESVLNSKNFGVATAAFVRELYSDKVKGKILDFYKERAQQYYDGHVEEINFGAIGDILRRRTNLLIKRQTLGRVPEYLRGSSLSLRPPLAGFSANIFQTDCEQASTEGRDGEMYFVVRPSTRQRRLVPVPAAVWRSGFLAGYEPGLDATAVCLGAESVVSTLFVLPGQQGQVAPGDGLARLEQRLIETSYRRGGWSRLLRSLLARPGLELQVPRFSHRSVLNVTGALQRMGLKDLFNAERADLRGLNGLSNDLHLSDVVQINTFSTCAEDTVGARHHTETYPVSPQRMGRDDPDHYPVEFSDLSNIPLALRPRQARLPDNPRLRFDRPFLYMVRHNPTGMILHMGRFNPRLLP